MSAKDPQEICQLFQRYMAEGDIDAVLNLYDAEVVFLNRSGEIISGRKALRKELEPFASAKRWP